MYATEDPLTKRRWPGCGTWKAKQAFGEQFSELFFGAECEDQRMHSDDTERKARLQWSLAGPEHFVWSDRLFTTFLVREVESSKSFEIRQLASVPVLWV
jgi:hypothetical protein